MASIRPRKRKDGTTYFSVLWREDGRQRSVSADGIRRANQLRSLIEAHGTLPPAVSAAPVAAMTFAEVLDAHLEQLTGVTPRTVADYRSDAARDLLPRLGALPVASITRADIAATVNAWQTAGLASKTIANRHGLLSAVLNTTVGMQLRPDNPCRGMRLPRADDHDRDDEVFLTPPEFAHLLGHFPEQWKPLVLTLAGTGVRWGEAAALDVADVDLLAPQPTVRITKAVKRAPSGRLYIGPTKTKRSRRTLVLPPQVVDALVPLVAARHHPGQAHPDQAWISSRFSGALTTRLPVRQPRRAT